MAHPNSYKTLTGLLRGAERVLTSRGTRFDGQSRGMWLQNAEWTAVNSFSAGDEFRALRDKHAITRPQDLDGGHALFGVPLPTRAYQIGDTVPGVGRISDEVDTPHGRQLCISGRWYLATTLDSQLAPKA